MKPKAEKYYLLDTSKYYWSIDLQRTVKFENKLVVKCVASYQDKIYFGKLVNTSEIYNDIVTNNEIEFSQDDVIEKYDLHREKILFVDFIYNPGHAQVTEGKRSPEI